jgi:cysteine synthase B
MQGAIMDFPSIDQSIGNTRLVRLQRMPGNTSNIILAKMEGDNPAGSVKDLIEATSGNTGIALAMAAAMMGYRMTLIMPITATIERKMAMRAYGAELIEVTAAEGMEGARDQALKMQSEGLGKVLDQFNNTDNPLSHFEGTGPEIWRDTGGTVTHFVSSMGTTGTIMGVSAYLKEKNPLIEIIGLQPEEGASIPGIRRWPKAYLPGIFDAAKVDTTLDVSQQDAEQTMRRLAKEEGIFCGASAGGAVFAALKLSEQLNNAVIVTIICDRGDRYLSSGVYG